MNVLWIILGVTGFVAALVLLVSYICFRMAFYVPKKRHFNDNADAFFPNGGVYDPYKENMDKWLKETRALPHEEFSITSFDGLKLYGKYYEFKKGAPIELMFHGYRGSAERDLCGAAQRCFKVGRSALIVDLRAAGKSEGNVITFGINEHRDCLSWVDFMVGHFGSQVKIVLAGISMGASTVLMAASKPLPPNVIGVLADCGFSSAKAIIKKVISDMKLPPDMSYPFVRLGAKLFGHFDLEELSVVEAMKNCRVPAIFYHGEKDGFVPCDMSRENFEACIAKKRLVIMPDADHGLCYPVEPERYVQELKDFFGEDASYKFQEVAVSEE